MKDHQLVSYSDIYIAGRGDIDYPYFIKWKGSLFSSADSEEKDIGFDV